jgi:hypothetical protein
VVRPTQLPLTPTLSLREREVSLRSLGIVLIWVGVVMLAGLLVQRFRRGAWSLEDDEIPPVALGQKIFAGLAMAVTTGGTGLVIWSIV